MKKQNIEIKFIVKHSSDKGDEYISADTKITVFAKRASLFMTLENFERKLKKLYPTEKILQENYDKDMKEEVPHALSK